MAEQIKAAKYLEVSAKTRKGLDKVFKVAVNLVQAARGVTKGSEPAPPVQVKKKKKGCLLM